MFLHAEVWGLPFFLGGLLARRADRRWLAAALILVAAAIRELYVLGLAVALVADVFPAVGPWAGASWWAPSRSRRAVRTIVPWVAALCAGAVLYGIHAYLASSVLSAHGYEARFGNGQRTVAFVLQTVAPATSPAGEAFGVVVTGLGVAGLIRFGRRDPAAWIGGTTALMILGAAEWATRSYWSAAWAIPLTVLAPCAVLWPRPQPAVGNPIGR
jgi:hypothetical protein